MDETIRGHVDNLHSTDKAAQNEAYYALMEATAQPVDWACEVWDMLVADLRHKDNHSRSIAAQLLSNLAQSDPENRIFTDFDTLFAVTRDDRFVTARHALQAIWKVGLAGKIQQEHLMQALEQRYHECAAEKNCTLIRYDIVQGLANLYDVVKDDTIRAKALEWIELETNAKYRKKYATVWKNK